MTTPTDFFGIGTALRAMFATYSQTARRTGRTTRLLDVLRDGDRVIVASIPEQRHLNALARGRGLAVEVRCVPPRDIHPASLPPIAGRTHLDHGWIEKFYETELAYAERAVAEIQARLQPVEPSPAPSFNEPTTWGGLS